MFIIFHIKVWYGGELLCLWVLPHLLLRSPQILFSGNTSPVPSDILYTIQIPVPSLPCFRKQSGGQGPPVEVRKLWAQILGLPCDSCDLCRDRLATGSLGFLIYKTRVLFILHTIIANLELNYVKWLAKVWAAHCKLTDLLLLNVLLVNSVSLLLRLCCWMFGSGCVWTFTPFSLLLLHIHNPLSGVHEAEALWNSSLRG